MTNSVSILKTEHCVLCTKALIYSKIISGAHLLNKRHCAFYYKVSPFSNNTSLCLLYYVIGHILKFISSWFKYPKLPSKIRHVLWRTLQILLVNSTEVWSALGKFLSHFPRKGRMRIRWHVIFFFLTVMRLVHVDKEKMLLSGN